jgi:hypothetical protein
MAEIPAPIAALVGAATVFEKQLKLVVFYGSNIPTPLPGRELHRGQILLRHALPFIYEPDAFFIQRIVDDFGRDFRGDDALDFAQRNGDAYPRASVIGIRASTGQEEQIFLKQLDLARWMTPVAYGGADAINALGQVHALVQVNAAVERIQQHDEFDYGVPNYWVPPAEIERLEQHLFR